MEQKPLTPYQELKGGQQILYALGHIGPGMLSQFITTWLLLFMTGNADNPILSGTLVGTATLLGRIMDAIADPIVANWSDNHRGKRYGRRIPFMMLGTLPMIISFLCIWLTPQISMGETARFIWLVVFLNGFYFFYTMVVNTYFALLPEIAKNDKQRIFIQSFVSLFGILGMGFSLGASGFLINALGYLGAGVAMSVFCALVMVSPLLVVKVRKDYVPQPMPNQTDNVFKNIVGAFKNDKFTKYIIGFATFYIGFQMIQYNLAFVTTVSLGLEKGMSSTLFIVSVVCALAFIPLYNVFVRKFGTIRSLMISMFSYALVALLIMALPQLHAIPTTVLGFVLMALLGFPYSGLMVIPNVLVSEIIDDDCARFQVRREAMFFGVQGLVNQIAAAFSSFFVGVLHDILGSSIGHSGGVTAVAPIAAAFALTGFFVMMRLNRKPKTPAPQEIG
ncbi:MAG TPA: MFS transporter [Feifaniaceae bacterium]|nr:MFS transporter [Feifaniaceae bacterium]